jgi:hypothetical protein
MIGVAVDDDLFRYWIPHYKALKLDSYTAFLHESGDERRDAAAFSLFTAHGFRVTFVPKDALASNPIKPGSPDAVRRILLETFALALPNTDYIITADGDEFQEWMEAPHDALKRGVGLVLGEQLDCFDETLHAPDPEKSLDENYPIREYNVAARWRKVPLNQHKICMAPADYPVEYSGSHEVRLGHSARLFRLAASGPIDVLHYRWRESALLRVKGRSYWDDEDLNKMKAFFSVGDVT